MAPIVPPYPEGHDLLAGKGILPSAEQVRPGNELAHLYDLKKIASYLEGCALNFKPHDESFNRSARSISSIAERSSTTPPSTGRIRAVT